MIRINLLTVEESASRKAVGQLVMGLLVVFLAIGAVIGTWIAQTSAIETRKTMIAQREQQLRELQETLKRIDAYRKEKKILVTKLRTIRKLRANQQSTVRLLDEIALSIPEGVWLTDLIQRGKSLNIRGIGMSWNFISQFVANLKERRSATGQRMFRNVKIGSVEKKGSKGGYTISSFKLRAEYGGSGQ